ncbi:MAG: hypothetical protein WB791_08270 [Waddliaceae bacterium]
MTSLPPLNSLGQMQPISSLERDKPEASSNSIGSIVRSALSQRSEQSLVDPFGGFQSVTTALIEPVSIFSPREQLEKWLKEMGYLKQMHHLTQWVPEPENKQLIEAFFEKLQLEKWQEKIRLQDFLLFTIYSNLQTTKRNVGKKRRKQKASSQGILDLIDKAINASKKSGETEARSQYFDLLAQAKAQIHALPLGENSRIRILSSIDLLISSAKDQIPHLLQLPLYLFLADDVLPEIPSIEELMSGIQHLSNLQIKPGIPQSLIHDLVLCQA